MDYHSLTGSSLLPGSIRAWIADDTLPAEQILAEAEAWIAARLRLARMGAVATGLLAAGADALPLPPRCLEVQALHLKTPRGWRALPRLPASLLAVAEPSLGGEPSGFAVLGEEALLDAPVAAARSWRLVHYAAPLPLSAAAPTNLLTAELPQLLRSACLMLGSEWRKDASQAAWWQARTEALLQNAQSVEDRDRARAMPVVAADPLLLAEACNR